VQAELTCCNDQGASCMGCQGGLKLGLCRFGRSTNTGSDLIRGVGVAVPRQQQARRTT
jgi:hypothetical protein